MQFVAQRRTNSLLIIAPPAEFEQIEALLKQLDQPLNKTEVSPHIYHVRNIDAKELSDVLNDIFGVEGQNSSSSGYYYYMMRSPQRSQDVGRLYGKVRFVHEPATNSIIVITNNKENFPIIEDLIAELDRTTSEYANTMVYTLENADAQEVANQLNTLFAVPGAGRPASAADQAEAQFYSWLMGGSGKDEERPISNLIGKVRVVADPRINALMITTSVQYFEVLRQLIQALDEESPKVLVEVQLIEVVRSREKRIGTRFASNSTIFEDKDFNSGFVTNFGVSWEDVSGNSVLSGDIKISALIQFLLRNFDSSILSQPSMTVNNNRKATLFVGSEVPFISQSQREAGTTARNDSYEVQGRRHHTDHHPAH